MLHRIFTQLLSSYSIFFFYSSVFSIFQFLGNFLRCIPGEDGPSSPIRYTHVLSHFEFDLSIDWLSIIVVFEIQVVVVTRIMRVPNCFALNSGAPSCTHSDITISELNFPQRIACRTLRWRCSRRSRSSE